MPDLHEINHLNARTRSYRRFLWPLLLLLPPLAPAVCVVIGVALDEAASGSIAFWMAYVLVGIGALSAGLSAALAVSAYIAQGSKLVFATIFILELPAAYLAWSFTYNVFVQSWK